MISISTLATGAATFLRKRGIDIAALFAGYPGRVGCYYGTKAGPSYSDILARNREALGPELVVSSFSAGAAGSVVVSAAGVLTIENGDSTAAYTSPNVVAVPGKSYFVSGLLSQKPTASGARILFGGVDSGSTILAGRFDRIITATTAGSLQFTNGASTVVGDKSVWSGISVREIADWSKLVLFDDANGTVPVFSVFQSSRGRGLLLDASQGLVRGAEQLTNGDFSAGGTGWILGPETTVTGGKATIASTGEASALAQTPSGFSSTKWYDVSFDAVVRSGSAKLEGAGGSVYVSITSTRRYYCVLTGVGSVVFNRVTACDIDIDNVSVRELPGNHMVQPTAAARGELSARYNQVPSSGNASVWAQNGTFPITVTQGASPTGGEMSTTSVTTGTRYFTLSVVPGMRYKYVACVRPPNANLSQRIYSDGADGAQYIDIVPASGVIAYASSGVTGVSEAIGGGWYRITATYPVQVSAGVRAFHILASRTESVDWGDIDVRLTVDAISSIPAYQRVTSATDYDDVGFPVYWRAQTDDWAKSHINPNGATKVLAMWGGQKMSDSAVGCLFESSVNWGGTVGSFGVFHSPGPGAKFGSRSSGSNIGLSIADTGTAYPDPVRSVLRHYSSIPTDECQLSVNGVQAATASADQGTGSYTEQDVFFGARAGTSLFANIREYAPPLILFQPTADPGLSASQIAALDKAYTKAALVTL